MQKMLCADNSEVLKVNTRELEFHVLAPNEPNVDIQHIVIKDFSKPSVGKEQKRFWSPVWHDGRNIKGCLELSQAIEQLSERQELLPP